MHRWVLFLAPCLYSSVILIFPFTMAQHWLQLWVDFSLPSDLTVFLLFPSLPALAVPNISSFTGLTNVKCVFSTTFVVISAFLKCHILIFKLL